MTATETELSFEQRVLKVARDRGITDEPTPLQHFEVLKFHIDKAKDEIELCLNDPSSGRQIFAARAIGQCLFDIIVQAQKQGVLLGEIIHLGNQFARVPPVWPLVDIYLDGLKEAIATLPNGDPLTHQAIAQVHTCLSAGSRLCLEMTPERCLEITILAKP